MNTNNAILITILVIFIFTGWVTPYMHAAFSQDTSISVDVEGLQGDVGSEEPGVSDSDVGFTDVMFGVSSMFFWTFGALPIWLDLLFLPMRIILYVILYDKIRGI